MKFQKEKELFSKKTKIKGGSKVKDFFLEDKVREEIAKISSEYNRRIASYISTKIYELELDIITKVETMIKEELDVRAKN